MGLDLKWMMIETRGSPTNAKMRKRRSGHWTKKAKEFFLSFSQPLLCLFPPPRPPLLSSQVKILISWDLELNSVGRKHSFAGHGRRKPSAPANMIFSVTLQFLLHQVDHCQRCSPSADSFRSHFKILLSLSLLNMHPSKVPHAKYLIVRNVAFLSPCIISFQAFFPSSLLSLFRIV